MYLQVVVIVLQHCGSGSLALPRCCRVAHSNENRPQMVFPALCSCTAKHSSRESHSNQRGYSEFMYLCHASALPVLFRLLFVHNLVWVFKRLYLHEKFERSASECGWFQAGAAAWLCPQAGCAAAFPEDLPGIVPEELLSSSDGQNR